MAERIGFVGLGIMGRGMVGNLLDAGTEVTVYNRTAERAAPFAGRGAVVETSPGRVAAVSDIVFTCVSDTPDVEEVIFGADGLSEGLAAGALVVDTSTVSPIASRSWSEQLSERGIGFLDAPISGGSEGAAQGTLSIMVGGTGENFARALPYLEQMGSTITHVGEVGDGQLTKLMNQVLVVTNMLGLAEALVFAQASGLDLRKAVAAVEGGAGGIVDAVQACAPGDRRRLGARLPGRSAAEGSPAGAGGRPRTAHPDAGHQPDLPALRTAVAGRSGRRREPSPGRDDRPACRHHGRRLALAD